MTDAPTPRRGRPRSEAIDAAILAATVAELVEHGVSGLQMEAVAARAGVAKTTVYRRWSDASELALAALRSIKNEPAHPPPGSVRDQLAWLLRRSRATWADDRYAAVMRRVAADANAVPDLYRDGRDRLVGPHNAVLRGVLRRGVAERVIRPDVDLELVRVMLVSPIVSAALTMSPLPTPAQVDRIVDVVLRGVAP